MRTKSSDSQTVKPSAGPGGTGGRPARTPGEEEDLVLSATAANTTNRELLKWMFRFLRPVKALCFLAALYLTLGVTVEVLTAAQMGRAVSHLSELALTSQGPAGGFWRWISSGEGQPLSWHGLLAATWGQGAHSPLRDIVLVLIILTLGALVLRYAREVAYMLLSMTMVFYIRESVYEKLQRVGFGFHDAVSTGKLINRSLTDLQNVRAFVQSAVLGSLDIVLVVVLYMAMLASHSRWLALLSLVPLPFWTLYILRFSKWVQPVSRAQMEAEDRNVSIIAENIAGVHVVKAFATERYEIDKYNRNCDGFFDRVRARIRLYANFQPVISGIARASHLSLYFVVAVLILRRKLEVGEFLFLGAAMGAILGRLQQVSVISDQYQNAIVSARRLYEVMMAPDTVPELSHAQPLPPGPGAVTFEHVTFGYDPQHPVLNDVSFSVKGGSVVAVVGPTGSGKTTLVNLIARFYDPQKGRVLIDGVDARETSLDTLRRQVAFVFQETYLFSDTVSGNIAYGRPHVSEGEVEAAARLAQAHEFIQELPKGYKTILGERGASLSGGQRQRLAIARAIVFDPRILVLDDATASVDPQTESLIRKGMTFVMKDRTTFLIAHRISSVKRASLVLVIEDGRITQIGTHDELMRQDGHYREIAAAQLYGDDVPGDQTDRPSHMDRAQSADRLAPAAADVRATQPTGDDGPLTTDP